MKKIIVCLLVAASIPGVKAQSQTATYLTDSQLSRWSIDVNFLGGITSQNLSWGSTNYFTNPVNDTISKAKYTNGSSLGYEAQLGYFFGKSRNFGIGLGLIGQSQSGTVTVNNYHMEYQSTDPNGSAFRQIVYSNGPVKESVKSSNMSIPLVAKYRKRLSKLISFNADAGLLFNLQMQNKTTATANFNYEALYAFDATGKALTTYDGTVSDNSAQVQQTEAYYFHTHANTGDVTYTFQDAQAYFKTLSSQNGGSNVGLGVAPNTNKSTVNYTTGSVGILLHPEVGFHLTDYWLINAGVFFMFQPFKNSVDNSYHLTDKMGEYNSVLAGSSTATSTTFGGNLGVRWYIHAAKGKGRDSDHDGVVNKLDRCPHDSGVVALQGCPDRDGDGIPDIDDSCKDEAGLAKFNGCPDRDGDGIPDKQDACPDKAGLAQFNGCPDTDGDGIPDKDDICPFQAGPIKFNGCPDTDGDGIPDNLDKCPNAFGPIENQGCPYDTAKVVKHEEVTPPPGPVDVAPAKDREVPVVEKTKKHKKEPKQEMDATGTVLISAPVLFDLNKSTIRESSKPSIAEAIQKINDNKNAIIVVEGYTDTTGPVSYNKVLSQMRANVLKNYLVSQGVSEDRIKSVGMGSKNPAADNGSKAGRMKNRRAEMKWGK